MDAHPAPDSIVAELRNEASSVRAKKLSVNIAMVLVAIAAILYFVLYRTGHVPEPFSTIEQFLPWILVFVGGGLMMAREKLRFAVQDAARFNDKRTLAPALELLEDEHIEARDLASAMIKNLLPKFDEQDFKSLSSPERGKLFHSLLKSRDLNYIGIVLNSARKFGALDAIQPLTDFTEAHIRLNKTDADKTQSLAHMALADIRMRVAKGKIEESSRTHEHMSLADYTKQKLGDQDNRISNR